MHKGQFSLSFVALTMHFCPPPSLLGSCVVSDPPLTIKTRRHGKWALFDFLHLFRSRYPRDSAYSPFQTHASSPTVDDFPDSDAGLFRAVPNLSQRTGPPEEQIKNRCIAHLTCTQSGYARSLKQTGNGILTVAFTLAASNTAPVDFLLPIQRKHASDKM